MAYNEHDVVSTLPYNDTAIILTSNHSITTRLKQQEMQHKTKKKKSRFFEQFCKYIIINYYYVIIYICLMKNSLKFNCILFNIINGN